MKLKRIIALSLSAASLALALTACGSSSSASDDAAQASGSSDAQTTVKLGVVGAIYEDIWAPAKEKLADEGIDLEFVQFSDYVTPNNALNSGEIDLNSFQHHIYLNTELEQYGYAIEPVGYTFIIPLNLYSHKVSSVDEIKDGDTIAIPDDVTNGGRAIKVLASAGLITLKEDAGFNPTVDDIESYTYNVEITPLASNTIPAALPDVTAAIVNANYAIDYGFKMDDALYVGDLNEEPYWTLIAARTEDLSDPDKVAVYDKIVKAFQSEGTKKVYEETFGGYYEPAGWDEDLLAPYKNA